MTEAELEFRHAGLGESELRRDARRVVSGGERCFQIASCLVVIGINEPRGGEPGIEVHGICPALDHIDHLLQ